RVPLFEQREEAERGVFELRVMQDVPTLTQECSNESDDVRHRDGPPLSLAMRFVGSAERHHPDLVTARRLGLAALDQLAGDLWHVCGLAAATSRECDFEDS